MHRSPMVQVYRNVVAAALLCTAIALLSHCAWSEEGGQDLMLPVTVESGFWLRDRGDVVVGTIPAEALGNSLDGRWQIDPESIQVLSSDGTANVPFRLSFRDDGGPDRLALQLGQRLAPLSSIQYSLRFRRIPGEPGQLKEASSPGATFPWPGSDPQLMRQRNGGFEEGGEKADGWSIFRGEVCTENPHRGRRCAKLSTTVVDSRNPTLTSQAFPISPNCRYTLKLRARGVKIGEEGTLIAASLYFLGANRRTVKTKPFRAHFGRRDLPNAWTTISSSEAAPPEARYGEVRIHIYRGRGTLWVDDVEVIRPVSAQVAPAMVRFGRVTGSASQGPL